MRKKRKSVVATLLNVFVCVIISLLFTGCGKKDSLTIDQENAVVPGTNELSYATAITIGNGVNLQPSYYNNGDVTFGWALMKKNSKIKTVRIEIEPAADIAQVKSWIRQATKNGFAVIATYHKYTVLGTDDPGELTTAANWWKANYNKLSRSGTFTINLMNEWGSHTISSNAYAAAYNNAISIVRQVYSGAVIIDCPGWGQETATAAAAAKGTNGTKLSDDNIIFSVHLYPNGWNQAKNHVLQNSDLDDLGSAGRPCIVGEFGNAPSGNANWSGMVTYAKSKGWAVLGWAWNGDGGSMNMVTPPWSSNPTASPYNKSSYFTVIYDLL